MTESARIVVQTGKAGEGHTAELNGLSLGYGFHQAWIFAVLFGTAGVFGVPLGASGLSSSPVFSISIIVNALCLLGLGLFDQKLLRFLIDRRNAAAAAVLMVVGTLLILGCGGNGPVQLVLCALAGVLTGLGSAVLIVFWGTAFARMGYVSIALNTAAATVVSVLVYALVLHALPAPWSGVLAALLPLAEVYFLWNHTPVPYSQRREVPIFNPLPVNHARFALMMGIPLLLFGLPLGYMRECCTAFELPATSMAGQTPLLAAAGVAALIVVLAGFASADEERVDFIARVLVPVVALSMFFIPLTYSANALPAQTAVMVGFMCFEALIWVLMGCYAQRYRISPILIFGAGRGAFALGAMIGILTVPEITSPALNMYYGMAVTPFLLTVCLVVAFAVLPHRADIRKLVILPEAPAVADSSAEASVETPDVADAVGVSELPNDAPDATPTNNNAHANSATPTTSDAQPSSGQTLFRTKCERIADRYLLSARESEVLFYLARGFNSAALQEKLFISEGTAKTHIRHIYGKTNVHNQQELMKMVADEWIEQ